MSASSTGKEALLTLTSNTNYSVDGAAASTSHYYTASFDYTDNNSISNIFGRKVDGNQPLYLHTWFKNAAKVLTDATPGISASIEVVNLDWTGTDYKKYSEVK